MNIAAKASARAWPVQGVFYANPDQYPPIINGARLLAEAGFELDLFCRGDGAASQISYPNRVRLHRIPPRTSGSLREYAGFIQCVLRQSKSRAAAVMAHDMHALLPARLLARRYRCPLIYQCHDYQDLGQSIRMGGRVVRTLQRYLAPKADLITIPDAGLGQVMARELHLNREPIVVPNAPIRRFAGGDATLSQSLAAQGKRFEQVVLRQGRIGPHHAIEATLHSLPYWRSPDWGFVLLGTCDGAYRESLDTLVAKLSVGNRFAILPPVPYDDVGKFTVGADVGHALYEPVHINNMHISGSCKIQEYMAAGLPLLVSDRSSLRELVESCACGVVADESSPESIAQAVNALLSDREAATRMGEAGASAFEHSRSYRERFAPVIELVRQRQAK